MSPSARSAISAPLREKKSGSCSFLYNGGAKAKKANFEGIVVLGAEAQSGFYLWDATGYYDDPKTG